MLDSTRIATISDLINYGHNLDISHAKVHTHSSFMDKNGNQIILNYTSLLDKYYDYIKKIIIEVTLDDNEYYKYRFQPKLLSYDIYGTTELWSSILRINNIVSASQFTITKVKLFTQDIQDVINEILILEDRAIKLNNNSIKNVTA